MGSPTKTRLVMLAFAIVLSGCTSWSEELATWRLIEEPDGATLQVQAVFGGSSCTRFKEWTVEETEEAVTVEAVIERSSAPDCTSDEVHEAATIRLDTPLGQRQLKGCDPARPDASCDNVVHQP